MRQSAIGLALAALALVACSDRPEVAKETQSFDVAEMPAEEPMAVRPPGIVAVRDDPAAAPVIAQAAAQIAYSYGYSYTLPARAVAAAQARHVALCDALGPARCRIVRMERMGGVAGDYAGGTLQLIVAAPIARDLAGRLDASVKQAGGTPAGRTIAAEDLSKQIVDTAARIRAKQALADRLLGLIQTRGGKVGELVEAERAFATAQEELDAARSWIAEMRQRVAMSNVSISYATATPESGGAWSPVHVSLAESGRNFGESLAAMLTFVALAAPWILLLAALLWLGRRLGWRWRLRWPWRRGPAPPAP